MPAWLWLALQKYISVYLEWYFLFFNLSFYLRSTFLVFFFFPPLLFNFQAPALWQILLLWAFFFSCWLQNQCCSFWCLQFKCFSPAPHRPPGHPLSLPFLSLSPLVLTCWWWDLFFSSEPGVLDLQRCPVTVCSLRCQAVAKISI